MTDPTAPRDELVTLLIDYLDTAPWFWHDSNSPDVIRGVRDLADVLIAAGWTKGDV